MLMNLKNTTLADQAMQKATKKILPFLLLMFVFAYLDRINIGFAKQALQLDVGFSDAVFALGVGLFFIGYAVFGAKQRHYALCWSAALVVPDHGYMGHCCRGFCLRD